MYIQRALLINIIYPKITNMERNLTHIEPQPPVFQVKGQNGAKIFEAQNFQCPQPVISKLKYSDIDHQLAPILGNRTESNLKTSESVSWDSKSLEKLFTLFKTYGTRWSVISREMKFWSEGVIKNKFNSSLRKFTRKVSLVRKHKKKNPCKTIQLNTVVSLIHYPDDKDLYTAEDLKFAQDLKQAVFQEMVEIEMGKNNIQNHFLLEERIHQFTITNKIYLMNLRKKKIGPVKAAKSLSEQKHPSPIEEGKWFHSVIDIQTQKQVLAQRHNLHPINVGASENYKNEKHDSNAPRRKQSGRSSSFSSCPCKQQFTL